MTKHILFSGASGGIGQAAVKALAGSGFTVFAGVLNEREAAQLSQLGDSRIVPLVLDVMSGASIEATIDEIKAVIGPQRHLYGVVNNAGVNYNAPLQHLTLDEIHRTVGVNLTGGILLTRAAFPLLKHKESRVVFTGSATGLMASPTVSVYAATKSALEGLADALRLELGIVGISVSLIQPGVIRTPMTSGAPAIMDGMFARMDDAERSRYGGLMRKIVDMSAKDGAGIEPIRVADAMVHALTAARPKSRYRVGADCKALAILRHLPDGARDFIQRKTFGI